MAEVAEGHIREHVIDPAQPILITCHAVVDSLDRPSEPTAILIESRSSEGEIPPNWHIHAIGGVEEVSQHPLASGAFRLDLPGMVVTPAFVNAHTHLDLTHIGPRPFAPASPFADWVGMILKERATDGDAIRASVEEGIRRSLAGGVIAVGDIAGIGRTEPVDALRASPLVGVSFVEYFGLGSNQDKAIAEIDRLIEMVPTRAHCVVRSIQPHAPYSAGRRVYAHAAEIARELDIPVCTHLAETMDERTFVSSCEGPMTRFLESLGLLDDAVRAEFGGKEHPVEHVSDVLRRAQFIVAHVNDCPDECMPTLARTGATVAYCPRAHEYFGHLETLGPHRYREMLDAGIDVVLATDSIINLPAEQAGCITPLDDARLLFRRDGTDAQQLLRMITSAPARALGIDETLFTITPDSGTIALCAIEVGGRESGSEAGGHRLLMASDAEPVLILPGADLRQTVEALASKSR